MNDNFACSADNTLNQRVADEWRDSTIDIDLKMVPERDALFRALPELKERLEMNIELAAPDRGIPA
ncbi:MAG: hypothetical protein ABIS03_06800 [Gemmatimonadaceae bacterium]